MASHSGVETLEAIGNMKRQRCCGASPFPITSAISVDPRSCVTGELSRTACKLIVGKRPGWLSHAGAVAQLTQHLRKSLGRPHIPELTEHPNCYFRVSGRKKFESTSDYITRKTDLYARAQQALDEGAAQQEGKPCYDWHKLPTSKATPTKKMRA